MIFDARIRLVESPAKFSALLLNHDASEKNSELVRSYLQNYTKVQLSQKITLRQVYIGLRPCNEFARVLISSIFVTADSRNGRCFLIDHGIYEDISAKFLYEASPTMRELPSLYNWYQLAGIAPTRRQQLDDDDYDFQNTEGMWDFEVHQCMDGAIKQANRIQLQIVDTKMVPISVNLLIDGHNFAEILMQNHMVESVSPGEQREATVYEDGIILKSLLSEKGQQKLYDCNLEVVEKLRDLQSMKHVGKTKASCNLPSAKELVANQAADSKQALQQRAHECEVGNLMVFDDDNEMSLPCSGKGAETSHSVIKPLIPLLSNSATPSASIGRGILNANLMENACQRATLSSSEKKTIKYASNMPEDLVASRQQILRLSSGMVTEAKPIENADVLADEDDGGLMLSLPIKKSRPVSDVSKGFGVRSVSQPSAISPVEHVPSMKARVKSLDVEEACLSTSDVNVSSSDDLGYSTADSRFFVDDKLNVKNITELKNFGFSKPMLKVLSMMDIRKPSLLQGYVWASIMSERNSLVISHEGQGRILAFCVPIIDKLTYISDYAHLRKVSGPKFLVLCPSCQQVDHIYKIVKSLIPSSLEECIRCFALYSASQHNPYEVVNGCDILISTPKCLLEFAVKRTVALTSLYHLVLFQADEILKKFVFEITRLLDLKKERCHEENWIAMRHQLNTGMPKERQLPANVEQIVILTEYYDKNVIDFLGREVAEPAVLIANPVEAALYGHVEMHVEVCDTVDHQIHHLTRILTHDKYRGHKTIVVCSNPQAMSEAVHKMIKLRCFYCAHQNINIVRQSLLAEWSNPFPVFFTDNGSIESLKIRDASLLIHLQIPAKRSYFGIELWSMSQNFQKFHLLGGSSNQPKNKVSCVSFALLLRTAERRAPHLLKLLQRTGSPGHPELLELCEQSQKKIDAVKHQQLCPMVKIHSVSHCRLPLQCPYRHKVIPELDLPGSQKSYLNLPTSGTITFRVTEFSSEFLCFWVNLISHTANKKTTSYKDYLELQMINWYNQDVNKVTVENQRIEIQVNKLYAIQDAETKVFYRALLVKKGESGSAQKHDSVVNLVDFGKTKSVAFSELYFLPDHFAAIPYKAIEVILCRIQPPDCDTMWSPKARLMLKQRVENDELEGKIVLSLGNTLWLFPVIKTIKLGRNDKAPIHVNITQELIDAGIAERNENHLESLYQLCEEAGIERPAYKNCSGLPIQLNFEALDEATSFVDVLYIISPSLFYVRKRSMTNQLDDLHYDLKVHVNMLRHRQEHKFQKGMLVIAALVEEQISSCYRARIEEIFSTTARVFFVDIGDEAEIGVENLYDLPHFYRTKIPFQAIACSLYGIKPCGDDWSLDSVERFTALTRNADEESYLMILSTNEKPCQQDSCFLYQVKLLNHLSKCCVGYELVSTCAAIYSEQASQQMFPVIAKVGQCAPLIQEMNCIFSSIFTKTDWSLHGAHIHNLDFSLVHDDSSFFDEMEKCGLFRQFCLAFMHFHHSALYKSLAVPMSRALVNSMRCLEESCVLLLPEFFCYLLDPMAEDITLEVKTLTIRLLCQLRNADIFMDQLLEGGILSLCLKHHDKVLEESEQTFSPIPSWCCDLHELMLNLMIHEARKMRPQNITLEHLKMCQWLLCQPSLKKEQLQLYFKLFKLLVVNVNIQIIIRKIGLMKDIWVKAVRTQSCACMALEVLIAFCESSSLNAETLLDLEIGQRAECWMNQADLDAAYFPLLAQLVQAIKTREKKDPQKDIKALAELGRNQIIFPKKRISKVAVTHKEIPEVLFMQDRWNLRLTVLVKDCDENQVKVSFSKDHINFFAICEDTEYSFEFTLYEHVLPEFCHYTVFASTVQLGLRKAESCRWPRACRDKLSFRKIKLDNDCVLDSSDDESDEGDAGDKDEEPPLDILNRKINSLRIRSSISGFEGLAHLGESKYASSAIPDVDVHSSDYEEQYSDRDSEDEYMMAEKRNFPREYDPSYDPYSQLFT